MGTVTTFDHTADVGLRITGADMSDLFRTAAEGMFDYVVVNRDEVRETETESLELEAETTADLLMDWLGELIFRSETGHRLYKSFDVQVDGSGTSLRATIAGEGIDPERHVLDHEVKAVTRHGLFVEKTTGGWTAEVILDI
jgi:SHS2 domain-containing protein